MWEQLMNNTHKQRDIALYRNLLQVIKAHYKLELLAKESNDEKDYFKLQAILIDNNLLN